MKACVYCGGDTANHFITARGGVSHPQCYYAANPIPARVDFRAVLCNDDDQVTVRSLLEELVPQEIKIEIVRRFNEAMRALQTRRTQS